MNTPRHYEKELRSIGNLEDYQAARLREKRLFMERWGLLPDYEVHSAECSLHEVEVKLKDMPKEQIPAFINQKFGRYTELLEVDDNYVRFLHFLDCSFDPAEIDIALYYVFGDYELGVYRSYLIR